MIFIRAEGFTDVEKSVQNFKLFYLVWIEEERGEKADLKDRLVLHGILMCVLYVTVRALCCLKTSIRASRLQKVLYDQRGKPRQRRWI